MTRANPVKGKRGRPARYQQDFVGQAAKLCRLGATDVELADFFGVTVTTLNNWKKAHPDFLVSIKAGKVDADAEVEAKLFHRATGYSHPEVHVSNFQGLVTLTPLTKHYPPDTTAAIFWLKNRQPEKWRDIKAVEMTGAGGGPVVVEVVRFAEATA